MLTIGEQLKTAREARKLTIKQIVQAIHVRANYLEAMEADDFPALPSAAQARGFLRIYAEYLELDSINLIERLRAETDPTSTPATKIEPPPPVPKPPTQPIPPPVRLKPIKPLETQPAPEYFPPGPSQSIFREIGVTMRTRRELISLTLDEVERHTHVRKHNLDLIEAGEFDKLPSPVQLRGTLSTYAGFLDLDVDAILLRYADGIQSRRIERQGSEPTKSTIQKARIGLPSWLQRFISPDLIFGGSMILILLGLTIWGAQRIFVGGNQVLGSPTQGPSISDVLLATAVGSPVGQDAFPTTLIEDGTPLPTLDPSQVTANADTSVPTISSAVQVTVAVLDRTYLKVTVDGVTKQDGRVLPGSALTFDGSNNIEVLTGSGIAVQIIFNQANLGVMGNFGEVVDRVYTVNGVETPTPTPSPTPTITPKPSITPRPSNTFRPTLTPKDTLIPSPTRSPRPSLTPTP